MGKKRGQTDTEIAVTEDEPSSTEVSTQEVLTQKTIDDFCGPTHITVFTYRGIHHTGKRKLNPDLPRHCIRCHKVVRCKDFKTGCVILHDPETLVKEAEGKKVYKCCNFSFSGDECPKPECFKGAHTTIVKTVEGKWYFHPCQYCHVPESVRHCLRCHTDLKGSQSQIGPCDTDHPHHALEENEEETFDSCEEHGCPKKEEEEPTAAEKKKNAENEDPDAAKKPRYEELDQPSISLPKGISKAKTTKFRTATNDLFRQHDMMPIAIYDLKVHLLKEFKEKEIDSMVDWAVKSKMIGKDGDQLVRYYRLVNIDKN